MNHYASPAFWDCYKQLPEATRNVADKNFALLKADSMHPSLLWFWIGNHTEYERLIGAEAPPNMVFTQGPLSIGDSFGHVRSALR